MLESLNLKDTGLEYLDASYNRINEFNKLNLPDSIVTLKLNNNHLPTIDQLPSNLIYLNVSGCNCYNISTLPANLLTLKISSNKISSLNLPGALEYLNCTSNDIGVLTLNNNLAHLFCSANKIKKIYFNNKLIELSCSHNQLTDLMNIPGTLTILICVDNPINKLKMVDFNTIFIDQHTLYYIDFMALGKLYLNQETIQKIASIKIQRAWTTYKKSKLDINYINMWCDDFSQLVIDL